MKKSHSAEDTITGPNSPVVQKSATPDPSARDPKKAVSEKTEAAREADEKKDLQNRPPDQAEISKAAEELKEKVQDKNPHTEEEVRSGQAVQPPTPVNKVISHQPGQANGPNQAEQERTDKGIFKDPNS